MYDRYPLFQVSADTDISADILLNKKSTFSKHKFRTIFLSMKSVMILMIILITLISNCIAIIFVQNEIKFTVNSLKSAIKSHENIGRYFLKNRFIGRTLSVLQFFPFLSIILLLCFAQMII